MPTAPATKPKPTNKPRSIAGEITSAHRTMLREALAKWRGWARAIADGGDAPPPVELLSVGTLLRIPAPASALEQDAAALTELEATERGVALCQAEQRRALEPWGGDRQKLAAAIDSAEAEAKRLREILDHVDSGCGEPYWRTAAGQVRASARRAFVECEAQLLAALEVEA